MRAIDADAVPQEFWEYEFDGKWRGCTIKDLLDSQPTIQPDNNSENPNGSDVISRQAAIKATWQDTGYTDPFNVMTAIRDRIQQLPPIQPDNGLQKLADEIASFKRHVKSDNSDYLTGYLCALSVVEGMIAERRDVTT